MISLKNILKNLTVCSKFYTAMQGDVVPALERFHIVKQVWKRKARKQKETQTKAEQASPCIRCFKDSYPIIIVG